MVANKVTKANRFQKRTAAKNSSGQKRWRQKEENKDKDYGERGSTTQETYVWVTDVYNITYYMFCFHSCHCNSSLYSVF